MIPAAPVIIGFDGSPPAERALRESATLLGFHRALVVTVWEAGSAYEVASLPISGLELPPAVLDVRGAIETDRAMYEAAQRTAQRGAVLAKEAGYLDAEGLAVADALTVADTLVRVARERSSPGIVVGAHGHRMISELLLGSTSHSVIRKADCPVVVIRQQRPGRT